MTLMRDNRPCGVTARLSWAMRRPMPAPDGSQCVGLARRTVLAINLRGPRRDLTQRASTDANQAASASMSSFVRSDSIGSRLGPCVRIPLFIM